MLRDKALAENYSLDHKNENGINWSRLSTKTFADWQGKKEKENKLHLSVNLSLLKDTTPSFLLNLEEKYQFHEVYSKTEIVRINCLNMKIILTTVNITTH